MQVDSLQTVVEEQMYQAEMLSQISQYLDSVEVDRQWLRTNLETGIPEDDYIARMKRINQYLEEADYTIGELEKTRVAYLSQVRRLKKDLEEALAEIEQLQRVVSEWQARAEGAEETLKLTQEELDLTKEELEARNAQLASAEGEIQSLMSKVTLSQGETLYAKGESQENIGNKTFLSRKKKRAAYEAALDYYTQALELGHTEAQAKVDLMKEKLKIE